MELTRRSRIRWERAKELRKRGEFQEAEEVLKQALDEEPENLLLMASLAEVYLRQERPLEARVLAEAILAANAHYPQAIYILGEVYYREKNFKEALHCFQQAAQKDKRPYLTLRVARTLRSLEQYQEALETVDSILLKHQDSPSVLKEKAIVLNRMGRYHDALSVYEDLRSRGVRDDFVGKEIVRLKALLSEREVTVEELRKVADLPSGRNNAQIQGLMGTKLKNAGMTREAAEAFKRAGKLEPDNPYFIKQEGYCRYHAGEYAEALRCLTQALRKDPDDVYVKATLEKIYVSTGDLEDYLDLLEGLVQEHPQNFKLLGTLKGIRKRVEAEKNRAEGTP
ncbi:MAG: tetratricopeptide repeat protein [Deltaproteobacteria bacterium]|nr:tetratricopeptide repeat protein [Deltaproteobacteria bacterium]MBW2048305.1 tetratricopeptide repeat protein [Deltaproteobacteria bacterium]MBW2110360.1 tetratricopeptide repeat protein [Deltaproteobacteria bacterium]MBW2353033.1 tetratricopeptide repeat protein [Deltaproteobacteria bacterium]